MSTPSNAPPPESAALLAHLIAGAERLCGQLDVDGLVRLLPEVVAILPGVVCTGVGVFDDERGNYANRIIAVAPPGAEVRIEEYAAALSQVEARVGMTAGLVSLDLAADREPIRAAARALGGRRYLGTPLLIPGRLVGEFFCAFADPDVPSPEAIDFIRHLGRSLAPVLWNCLTRARFERGDRRRDTLIELMHLINNTLQLDHILDSARDLIGKLDGHRVSGINLLDESGQTVRSFRLYTPPDGTPRAPHEPEVFRVSDSPISFILQHGRPFASEDLTVQTRFIIDVDLLRYGVRRYVAAPMFARGRIIGAFFFGTADPHVLRRADIWLFENIALQLALAIDNAMQHEQVKRLSERLNQQAAYLQEEIKSEHDFEGMIGRSGAMLQVRAAIARVAPTQTSVLISGETGVGKELVARAIHAQSPRANQPMVKVNCAAIPESMVESELFGHERGAFTSAVERRIGRFELAADSTLFLDEVGELSPAIQAKLLRVLQDGEFERVGGSKTLSTNARIIAATNRDLLHAVEAGSFRSDLYYRLSVFPIVVPPLRARSEDIPILAESFVAQFNRRMGKHVRRIHPATLDALRACDWLGNVRELRSAIERAMILCDQDDLVIDGLAPGAAVRRPAGPPPVRKPLAVLRDAEAEMIRTALRDSNGIVEGARGAAARLGLKASTLRYRMKLLGIERLNQSA
ncbi:MAG: sigma 54-interacting transcriptional regulator [Phycisphaerae bacterium]